MYYTCVHSACLFICMYVILNEHYTVKSSWMSLQPAACTCQQALRSVRLEALYCLLRTDNTFLFKLIYLDWSYLNWYDRIWYDMWKYIVDSNNIFRMIQLKQYCFSIHWFTCGTTEFRVQLSNQTEVLILEHYDVWRFHAEITPLLFLLIITYLCLAKRGSKIS